MIVLIGTVSRAFHSAVRLYRSRAHREKADHAEAKGTLVPDAGKVRAAMDAVNSS